MKQNDASRRLPEPVRALMEWAPAGRARLLLGAAITACFALMTLRGYSELVGAGVVTAVAAGCFALLLFALFRQAGRRPLILLLCLALIAWLGVSAHLSLLTIRPGRMTRVLDPLLDTLWNYDLPVAMAWEEGHWSAGYLIVMALFSRLETFPALYAVKLLDLACLTLAAMAVGRLARLRGAGLFGGVAAVGASMLLPTVLFNAGLWAQCDAIFAALTLWGLVFLLDKKPLAGCVCWGFALAFKLQSAFLFPLLIPLFMRRKVGLRHIAALLLCFMLPHLPMLLNGQSLSEVLGRYNEQILFEAYGDMSEAEDEEQDEDAAWAAEGFHNDDAEAEEEEAAPEGPIVYDHVGLATHAPGVYHLMTVASTREFSGMGLYLAIACALMVALTLTAGERVIDNDTWLTAALLLACGLPLILPQMNARCLYLAGLLSLTRISSRTRLVEALGLEFVSFCAYMEAIFSTDAQTVTLVPMSWLSLIALGCMALAARELYLALRPAREGGA